MTDFTYEFNRLKTASIAGQQATYNYDEFGRLKEVTGPSPAKYVYDGFDRVIHEEHGPTLQVQKDSLYDALDRTAQETVTNGTTTRKTRFNYLGTSEQVAAEEQPSAPGASTWKVTKVYNYGPDDRPLMMTSTPIGGETKTRFYSTNPRGDVEALTDPSGGQSTATYRYYAYGSLDESGTKGEDAKDTTLNSIKEPLNPYRYNGKRVDTATGGIDMGFRNYNPGLNTFLTRDMYNGALADMRLGLDPWNANRYAFAGGNPITRVELDGHYAVDEYGNRVVLPDPNDSAGSEDPAPSGGGSNAESSCPAPLLNCGDTPSLSFAPPPVLPSTFATGVAEAQAARAAAARSAGVGSKMLGMLGMLLMLGGDSVQNEEQPVDTKEQSNACRSGMSSSGASIYYYPLDGEGRATGAVGCFRGAIPKGLRASEDRVTPKGFEPGVHHRGHLIANVLGGSNADPRNFVPLHATANLSGMKRVENHIRGLLNQGDTVYYGAVPIYSAYTENPYEPKMIHLFWQSTSEPLQDRYIPNVP